MAEQKKRLSLSSVRSDAKELIWSHRYRLALGMLLMMVNRLVGLVLPASSKYLIDDVIIKHRSELLLPLALAAGGATVVQALSSFALSQVLGVAAQRAITEMRKSIQEHIARLPIRYFDSTQTGILISRIMTDAEGIRNLVGTGLVQLIGGLVTAVIALGVLFYLSWTLTLITLLALAAFGSCMAFAFKRLRPLFRERGQINAEVTGRLAESLGGVRIVKAYAAEKREELVFARGASTFSQRRPLHDGGLRSHRVFHSHRGYYRRDSYFGWWPSHSLRPDDPWRLLHVHLLHCSCGRSVS